METGISNTTSARIFSAHIADYYVGIILIVFAVAHEKCEGPISYGFTRYIAEFQSVFISTMTLQVTGGIEVCCLYQYVLMYIQFTRDHIFLTGAEVA